MLHVDSFLRLHKPNVIFVPHENNLLCISGECDDIGHVITQIKMACQGLSCFYITGHGIEKSLMENLLKFANNFFNLPKDVKTSISLKKSPAYRGYILQGTPSHLLVLGRPLYWPRNTVTGILDNS